MLDDGKKKLDNGAQELAAGEAKLNDARRQLAAGEQQLKDRRQTAQAEIAKARAELDAGKAKLEEAQKQYDAGKAEYEKSKAAYDKVKPQFDSVSGNYDAAIASYNALAAQEASGQPDGACTALEAAIDAYDPSNPTDAVDTTYAALDAEINAARTNSNNLYNNASIVCQAFGVPVPPMPALPGLVAPNAQKTNLAEVRSVARTTTSAYVAQMGLANTVMQTSISVQGKSYTFMSLRQAFDDAAAELAAAKAKLDEAKKQLDAGWAEYREKESLFNTKVAEVEGLLAQAQSTLDQKKTELEQGQALLNQKKAEYEEAKALYEQKLKEYESGKATLKDKKAELEKAKKTLEEKRKELEDAKAKLADVKKQLADMKEFERIVSPRGENGGTQAVSTMVQMMGNVRWAMASLFVLVGLFVCYSAVSRLVNDEVTQIGTKKALGFRDGEISLLYLLFSGMAVLVGTTLAVIVGYVIVQSIVNPVTAATLTIPEFPPYFSLTDLLLGGGIEMVLILLATWAAARGLLKRSAIDLLNGNQETTVKEHVWEKTELWKRMSLFSQTVVNNCINDKRRVIATLVGVMG